MEAPAEEAAEAEAPAAEAEVEAPADEVADAEAPVAEAEVEGVEVLEVEQSDVEQLDVDQGAGVAPDTTSDAVIGGMDTSPNTALRSTRRASSRMPSSVTAMM